MQTSAFLSHKPDESFVANPQKLHVFILYYWRKMYEGNLEQRINIKFCVKIDESAVEILIITYGEHSTRKQIFLSAISGLRVVKTVYRTMQEMGRKNLKEVCKCWPLKGTNQNLNKSHLVLRLLFQAELISSRHTRDFFKQHFKNEINVLFNINPR